MAAYRLGTVMLHKQPTPVALVDGQVFTLAEIFGFARLGNSPASITDLLDDWRANRDKLAIAAEAAREADQGREPDSLIYLSPISRPSKVICIGVNYRDHLAEMNVKSLPEYPYAFLRPHTSLAGHKEEIQLPKMPHLVDWEAELGIVIGRRVRGIELSEALDAIAGYTIINDISARDWIASRPAVGIDWVMQKAWDRFQPTGPWLTPAEFVPEPQRLAIELAVNGIVKQQSNTSLMIFGVREIVHHLASIMTLEPGDIIATGTPAGVGYGRNPPETIRPGDRVVVKIEGLGVLENRFH